MSYYEEMKEMSDEGLKFQLQWMERRQSDGMTCSFPGEDRSYRISVIKRVIEERKSSHGAVVEIK